MAKYLTIIFLVLIICIDTKSLCAQDFKTITTHSNNKISFRGLSIVGNIIWVSGSAGTVGRSTDGGKSWNWYSVLGYEKNDFRDIEAFDENTAIIMSIASPAYILKTTNGGGTWKKVYESKDTHMFLDAMAFKNAKKGVVIGDPIDGRFFVATTEDGGNSWQESVPPQLPTAKTGEAFFAASGTNLIWSGSFYYIVSGGTTSRILCNNKALPLPITQGKQMTGANSIATQRKKILVVGGNYNDLKNSDSTIAYSTNRGKSWLQPQSKPEGYKSCVCFVGKNKAIACGITGIDISYNKGKDWKNISKESFNTCTYSKMENAVYFAGNNGRIGKLLLTNFHLPLK